MDILTPKFDFIKQNIISWGMEVGTVTSIYSVYKSYLHFSSNILILC